jgi:large subunit ribosomal protein L3
LIGRELQEQEPRACRECRAMARKEGLIGWKRGMTQVFAEDGSHVPVTVIEAGPCTVLEIRTKESHGYDALQLGFGAKKKNVSKPAAGVFKKANVAPMRVVREVRLEKTERLQGYQPGQSLTVEMFTPGELVDVVGVTKGKGFQGGVKRHGWYGGDATHGSMFHRAPGSIGASSDPSRVWPGHHLPGRMGGDRRTVLNLSVVRVMPEQNLVLVRGAVPGATGSLVMLRKSVKATKAQQAQQKGPEKK